MIIESVEIRRFGKLTDFRAAFDGGFNLIEGMAESGKTTLCAFLSYMLYGFPVEKTDALTERTHYIAWEGGEAAGSMCFRAAGVRYRIERTSTETERGWRDTYALINLDTGLPEQGEKSPGERFLGVGYESFRDTAFLCDTRRGGLDALATADAIENILFSGEERLSTDGACRALAEARAQILSEDGRSGAVTVLEKERHRLAEQLEEATAAEQLRFSREEELYITRKKMEEARAEIDKFTGLEANYYNAMLIKEYDSLHELENTFDTRVSVIRAHEERYRAAGFLPDRGYLEALSEASLTLCLARRERAEAEETMAQLPAEDTVLTGEEAALLAAINEAGGEDALRHRAAHARKRMTLFLSSAILLSVLAVLALVFFFRTIGGGGAPWFGALALICLGATVLLSVEAVRARAAKLTIYSACHAVRGEDFYLGLQRAAEAALRLSQAKAERERTQMRLVRVAERLTLARTRLKDALALWDVSLDGDGAEQALLDAESEEGEEEALLHNITAQLSEESRAEFEADFAARVAEGMAAFAEKTPAPEAEDADGRLVRITRRRAEKYLAMHDALTTMHRDAEARVRALRKKLEGQNEVAVRARVAPEDRERYRNQNVDDLHHGVLRYRERLQQLIATERELTDALAKEEKNESLAATAERILALDGRIARLRERASVLESAHAAVKEGEARLRREISPRLGLDACRFLYEMTDGKYSELLVGKDFSLTFDEGEGARDVAYLSHSTEDLTYYALRLALVNLMYREEPPLCFDGCTARQDDERALCFLRAVRTLTEEGKQCFFFTSGSREIRLAGRVFSSYGHIKMPG